MATEAGRLIVAGAAILALSALLLGRLPLGALGALASGLAAYWLGGRRFILTLPGVLFGVCIGASAHAYLIGEAFGSAGDLLVEVARDALPGALVGFAAMAPVFFTLHLRAIRARITSQEDAHEPGDSPGRRLQ